MNPDIIVSFTHPLTLGVLTGLLIEDVVEQDLNYDYVVQEVETGRLYKIRASDIEGYTSEDSDGFCS